ncbi:MYCBP-associated protein isoform X2 [Heterocephalus glaber]|uniref:MYCBP-associated protein isoform X2 n=1 Tax=Heterocephalus glaber TaxID=10181 RepID=A0AAX6PTI5_HETGA|nr:MYCBP-associated protein isoform X2 [Heterocephalus glaber]
MKSAKKDSRVRVPGRFLEAAENFKDRKQAKIPEQPTPPIQQEPEPISSVLQGDDILALAIKKEDLKKQHIPRLSEDSPAIIQKFFIRKLKPKDSQRKICHLVAHPVNPDVATKPLAYLGPGDSFDGRDQILPHHILGTLQDFKRIAVARGNTQLAELIRTPPCLMTLISAREEPTPKAPKEKKRHPRAPPPQHNFLKHWQWHVALRKKQQKALSEHLKKPINELLMHSGETYRQIQEERELIDRLLPTGHDGKDYKKTSAFWSPLEYLGGEMTGLVITKTKTQRGFMEPITCIRKPRSIQAETGLSAPKDASFHRAWDRSLFLNYRRRELQNLMAELDFSQRDVDGLEVVGRRQPFSSVTVEDIGLFGKSQASASEDTACQQVEGQRPDNVASPGAHGDFWAGHSDAAPMSILGPSLLFCGKPACWIRGRNPQDKSQVGIGVRLTFETLEGEKTSSELTTVNNGTVAIWYDWRRWPQPDSFQDLKRSRMQRFYFNNREGVILPGETKTFTFFFKSLNAGIFRESWEFRTHPTVLGGALLLVTLQAVSLTQDIFRDERKLLESKLAAHESVIIVHTVLQELLRGILTPERTPSPVDTYVTEEDLFHRGNPELHYQHQLVQGLHRLWHQYMVPPLKDREPWLSQEEPLSSRIQAASLEKAPGNPEHFRSPVPELQLHWPESKALGDPRDPLLSQKSAAGTKNSPSKRITEEILMEEIQDWESSRSCLEPEGFSLPQWNLCLGDFRKAVMTLPEEHEREDVLIRLNRAALELCPEQRPLQPDLLYQLCLQLWRDVIDSLVCHSVWLRMLLGLPEKETIYVFIPEEQDQKSLPTMEMKVTAGRVGKEERKGAPQEKKQGGVRDKEDKKGSKTPVKEERVNSKKQKAKEDKKVIKSTSHDRLSSEDPTPESAMASQEPTDPLVMEKYMQQLHTEVYRLLDTLVMNLMVLADELSPMKDVEEQLHV